MRTIEKTVYTYIAQDGTEFDRQQDCLDYENKLIDIFFQVQLNEPNYPTHMYKICGSEFDIKTSLINMIFQKYGKTLQYVDGKITEKYIVTQCDSFMVDRPYITKYFTLRCRKTMFGFEPNTECEYYKYMEQTMEKNLNE